ncbi:hypothetical protein KSP40_PGU006649 [Platanthera guangdongensis]|uniref:Uncharacterized protein n=1 Tax=Platanthera guangdongensis TaxID=2320717 RepID=A0ABR2N1Y0_9ASPA
MPPSTSRFVFEWQSSLRKSTLRKSMAEDKIPLLKPYKMGKFQLSHRSLDSTADLLLLLFMLRLTFRRAHSGGSESEERCLGAVCDLPPRTARVKGREPGILLLVGGAPIDRLERLFSLSSLASRQAGFSKTALI